MKYKWFDNPRELTDFVNGNNVQVVAITESKMKYTLFYYETT